MTLWVTAVSFLTSHPLRSPPSITSSLSSLWHTATVKQGFHSLLALKWARITELFHSDTYPSSPPPPPNGKFKYHISAECNIHLARDNTLLDVSHVSGSEQARLSLRHQISLWNLVYKFYLKLVCSLFTLCFIGVHVLVLLCIWERADSRASVLVLPTPPVSLHQHHPFSFLLAF